MNDLKLQSIVIKFNECINNRDVDSLSLLMTDDHTFIDTDEFVVKGKDKMIEKWKKFFEIYPEYQNHFESFYRDGNQLIITGSTETSYSDLKGNFIWTAEIKNDLISEWRIYDDNEENRSKLGI